MKYKVTSDGFYGKYGGAFVPEMLYPNLEELKNNYKKKLPIFFVVSRAQFKTLQIFWVVKSRYI